MHKFFLASLLFLYSSVEVNAAASTPPRSSGRSSSHSYGDASSSSGPSGGAADTSSGDLPPFTLSPSQDYIKNLPPGTPVHSHFEPHVKDLTLAHPIDTPEHKAIKRAIRGEGVHRRVEQYEPLEYAQQESFDYMRFLKIEKTRAKITLKRPLKVGVVDSAADLENVSFSVTKSSDLPSVGSLEARQQHHHAAHKVHSHGNHVTKIITTIVPNALISYCNANFDDGGHYVEDTNRRAIECIHKKIQSGVSFINLSMKLHGTDNQIVPEAAEAIRAAARAGIGVIMGLGNDENREPGQIYAKSLMNLAGEAEIKGRLLLVAASKYNVESKEESIAEYSNHPVRVKDKHFVITAPGSNILSKGVKKIPIVMSGTSQATPIVTGISVLLQAYLASKKLPSEPEGVFDLLKRSARTKKINGEKIDVSFGNGIVNLNGAMILAQKEAGILPKKTRKQMSRHIPVPLESGAASSSSPRPGLRHRAQVGDIQVEGELTFSR